MESLEIYIPMDRRQAMVRGETLPDRATGAALFADISGFTPLTETLVQKFGPRRGVDELIRQLNVVYDALIAEAHRYRGAVVSFAGDAIICWFDGDDGRRAITCALAMQQVTASLSLTEGPPGPGLAGSLAIKAAVTSGPVRRFLVGDPQIRYIDVLAGATIDRLAEALNQARQREVVVGPEIIARLGDRAIVAEWRNKLANGLETDQTFAVVAGLTVQAEANPWPSGPKGPVDGGAGDAGLSETQIRPWLLPPVYERLKAGRGRFLAELRTAVALFLNFEGIDYDQDDAAGQQLDSFIRWVQNVLAHYEGYLIELTIGDKGSYLYGAFGAPLAYGDDAARAVAAALELQTPPPGLDFITRVRIGLSQGRMRAGPYGGSTRRTYGVQGSEVNIAARLMEQAAPGQVLISKHVAEAAARNYDFKYLGRVRLKGKQETIPVFGALNKRLPQPSPPIVSLSREEAGSFLEQALKQVLAGKGQILHLEDATSFGSSRLAADFIEQALSYGFQIIRGMCQPPDQGAVYTPWRQIFRAWFNLADEPSDSIDRAGWAAQQILQLQAVIQNTNADWLPLLPLLGDLLDVPITDNATTADLDPFLRQGLLLALALEIIQTWTYHRPSLLLLEDAHWLDKASQELTLTLARTMGDAPLLLILAQRPSHQADRLLFPDLGRIPYYTYLQLPGGGLVAAADDRTYAPESSLRPSSPKLKPLNGRPHATDASSGTVAPGSTIIGRVLERQELSRRLQALLRDQTGGVVAIEGEAGIGKSRLVMDLLEQARAEGATSLIGTGDPIEKSTPYHVWRPILSQLFNLETRPGTNAVADPSRVLSRLPPDPELVRLAPLLNVVLPLKLPENEVTRPMTGQARADNTHELLAQLLQDAASRSPILIVLEDAHWLDSASWALTRLISRRVQPILLIIVTRPLAEPLPAEYRQLLQATSTHHLRLEALPPEEALTLVCQRLGVSSLPAPIATLIRAKAAGHPFFSEELAYALRDAGVIRVVEGECRLTASLEDFSRLSLPDTIEDVITSRIDRLLPSHQLTLKVASVVGHLFPLRLLRDIYPVESDKPRLPDYLDTLERLDITSIETTEPDVTYIFKHDIIREVAYNLMLFTQRWELHRAVAEWLEQSYAHDLAPFYPLLAYHWSQAVRDQQAGAALVAKALDYLGKAGEQALRNHANQEAVRFFNEALDLVTASNGQQAASERKDSAASASPYQLASLLQQARWERQLGQAHLGLGNLAQSRKHLEQALALLGWPVPGCRWSLATGLIRQVWRQGWHRLRPAQLGDRTSGTTAALLEAARAYERLGEIYYWSNQTIPAIHAVLRTLNFSERAGPSPELARAYVNMCLVAGFISLHSLARAYSRQAQEVAQKVGHRPALVWVLEISAIYAIGRGEWASATTLLEQAIGLSKQLKDQRRWEECSTALGDVLHFQGKFIEGLDLWPNIYHSAQRRGDVQAQSWGLAGQLRGLLPQGRLDSGQVTAALNRLQSLLHENIGSTDEINSYGILALTYLRLGQLQQARQAIDAAVRLINQSSPTGFGTIHGYTSAPEVYLSLWEATAGPDFSQPGPGLPDRNPAAHHLQAKARQACQALHRYARIFPIGRPRAWLWQGLYHWLAGRPAKAHRAWRKSLAVAQQLAMPYEQGLVHYEIGRHLPLNDPARQAHLNRAAGIFAQLKATYHLMQTQQALGKR